METTPNDDLLSGAAAIGAYIGRTPRAVYHLCEGGKIPAFKLGGIWTTRKSRLNQHFDELERQHAQPAPKVA